MQGVCGNAGMCPTRWLAAWLESPAPTAEGDRHAAGDIEDVTDDWDAVGGAKVGTCAASDAAGHRRSRQSSSLEGRARPWLGTVERPVTRGLRCGGSPRRR